MGQPVQPTSEQNVSQAPELVCYALHEHPPEIVAARPDRKWMDEFPDRHPYRCLPLAIANSYAWHVICPVPVEVEWNGGKAASDLTARVLKPLPGGRPPDMFCRSVFTHGIVTMHLDYIFRTPPGWDLIASGPTNNPKENAYPLTGLVESSWLPYPFTMNWQIMRPGKVLFEEGEPFCSIMLVEKMKLLDCEPQIKRLSDDPELAQQARAFKAERDQLMARLKAGDPEARRQPWSKHYFLGELPDGTKVPEHLNKLRLKQPIDLRSPVSWSSLAPYRITIN
jgi:hypothetical protein